MFPRNLSWIKENVLQIKLNVFDECSSQNLELVYNYYTTAGFGLVYTQHVRNKNCGVLSQSKWRTTLFVLSRILALIYFAHLVFLYLGFYEKYFGKLDVFEKIEAFLWITIYFIYFYTDPLFLDVDFTKAIIQFFELSNNIWKHLKNIIPKRTRKGFIRQRNWKQLRLIIHSM